MKRSILLAAAAVLAMAGAARAQTVSPFYELTLDGRPTFQYGSQADCDNGALAAAAWPEVQAKGSAVVFDCPRRLRLMLAAGSVVTPVAPAVVTPPAAASRGLSAACESVVASDFSPSTSQVIGSLSTLAKPARGTAVREPAFGSCLVRATDHGADGVAGIARNEYSRRQAFNADSSKHLVVGSDGYWHVYDVATHAHLSKLPSFGVDPEPQWHPTDPNLLFVLPNQGAGLTIKQVDVRTGEVSTFSDFSGPLKALWPNAGLAYTKDEGSPSKDGRFWCFMVRDPSKSINGSWAGVGVFGWDAQAGKITGSMATTEVPDHVSASPSGQFCVVSSDGALGTAAYRMTDFTKKTQLLQDSQHSDLALAADGRDVYVTVSYGNSALATDGEMFFRYLDTGEKVTLIDNVYKQPAYIGAVHFSGKAFNRPGWILMDTDADDGDQGSGQKAPTSWMQRKVMAVQLKASPTIYTLAHTRAIYMPGGAAAPLASVNRDFTRIAFNSNWGVAIDSDVDVYMLEIPAGVIK